MTSLRRNELPSLLYWQQSPQYIAQRFYVAFCLFVSSVQDTFLGLRERDRQNLNWSTTCSYYGMVHSGRLLAFLALGNFPESHEELKWLFQGPLTTTNKKVRLNWLQGFANPSISSTAAQLAVQRADPPQYLGVMKRYFQGCGVQEARIDEFARMLAAAKPLREDGNYEALLIAHEHNHQSVTASFTDLARAMSRAAEESLSLVEFAYSAFVANDQDIESERDAYRTFLYDYLHDHMRAAITRKFGGSQHLATRLTELAERLQPTSPGANYRHLDALVSMTMFHGKRGLMEDFRRRICQLEDALPRS